MNILWYRSYWSILQTRTRHACASEDLDGFEVKQLDDAEETNLNHFQRCELKITDDNGNTFSTKNPFIINEVAMSIKALCGVNCQRWKRKFH
ncbi:hypothetical protein DHW03_02290 [Pedobacter yonginense]|uniref:Uncharacterized protein n=1 Tax=Pedobacter yonginense TaxID=651869 RepID=A0A317ERF2_9SPHI|nr:hypothetical protein DHW03_02290 [Pedobacter yonginense]